ncbi:MAG: hypothetical protein OEZ06_13795 [Myxococcales bacterium]|nr:hypothetical protein [Myxococcales bacterium]
MWLLSALLLGACAGQQPPVETAPTGDGAPGELTMREPEAHDQLDTALRPVQPEGMASAASGDSQTPKK